MDKLWDFRRLFNKNFCGRIISLRKYKIHIKEKNPIDLATAIQYVKQYKEARIGEDQMGTIDPSLYPSDLLYSQMGMQPPPYQPPHIKSSLRQSTIMVPSVPEVKNTKTDLLNKLVEEMADLRVQITNAHVKRSKPTNTRTNV